MFAAAGPKFENEIFRDISNDSRRCEARLGMKSLVVVLAVARNAKVRGAPVFVTSHVQVTRLVS